MAAKKPVAKKAEPTKTEEAVAGQPDAAPLAHSDDPNALSGDMLPADREVLQRSVDERAAALLKDLQDMGARPKD